MRTNRVRRSLGYLPGLLGVQIETGLNILPVMSGDALSTARQARYHVPFGGHEVDEPLERQTIERLSDTSCGVIDPHAQLEVRGRPADIRQIPQHGTLDVVQSHVAILDDLPKEALVRRPVCTLCHRPTVARTRGASSEKLGRDQYRW